MQNIQNPPSQSKRFEYIQVLRAITMLLVVYNHSSGVLPDQAQVLSHEFLWYKIYSLIKDWASLTTVRTTFFFIAAYVFAPTALREGYSYLKMIPKKFTQLIVPCFVLSTLAYPLKCFLSRFALRPIEMSLSAFLFQTFHPWSNTIIFFWFIPTLFLFFCVSPLLVACLKRKPSTILLTILLFSFTLIFQRQAQANDPLDFLNICGGLHYIFYFWAGMVVRQYKLEQYMINSVVFAALICFSFFVVQPAIQASTLYNSILMLAGVTLWFGLANLLQNNKLLQTLGSYSFPIYLLSWFPQIFFRILGQVFKTHVSFAMITMFLGGLLFPIFAVFIVKKYIPDRYWFLIGLGPKGLQSA